MIAKIRRLYYTVFFRSRFFLSMSALALIANILTWSLIFLALDTLYQPGREFIPLHYKVPVGPDYYTNWYWIFVIPMAGLLFIGFNFFFARFLYAKVRTAALSLMAVGFLTQVIFMRAVYLIIQINLY